VLGCEEQSWLQLGGGIVPIPGKEAKFTGEHQHVRKQPGRPELLRLFEGPGVGVLRLLEAVGVSQCHAKKEMWVPESGLIVVRLEGEGDSTVRQRERFPVPTLGLHGDRQCRQPPDGHRRAPSPLSDCECSSGCGLSSNKVAGERTTVARLGQHKGLVLELQTGRSEGRLGTVHQCDWSVLERKSGHQREAKRDVDVVAVRPREHRLSKCSGFSDLSGALQRLCELSADEIGVCVPSWKQLDGAAKQLHCDSGCTRGRFHCRLSQPPNRFEITLLGTQQHVACHLRYVGP
jgi:hypothetical protein